MRNKTLALILAAGKGTRLNSKYPKPLVPVLGVPMLHRIINTFESLSDIDIGVVIGNRSDEILKTLNSKIQYVYQRRQLGTAHAVKESKDLIDKYEKVFIMPADSVLINKSHIDDLINSHFTSNASCSFFSADFPFELPYAKIIRNNGNLIGCVEDIDANEKQKQIREFFTSHYLINTSAIKKYIDRIKIKSISGEYFLTDIISIMIKNKEKVNVVKIENYKFLMGINTLQELEMVEKWILSGEV